MKKVLFATTALVATAGVASADVALSGWAEMGIYGGGDDAANDTAGETQFFQDLDVSFTMSGTTDNGLTFGASVDLDENDAFSPDDDGGATIFISGDWGTLTMGDTDGALDWAVTENFGNPGSIDDSETLHAGYLGSFLDGVYDGQILRYDYSFDNFGFAVSVEMDDAGVADPGYAIGASYDLEFGGGAASFGIGYQYANVVGAAASGDFIIDNDSTSATYGSLIPEPGGTTVEIGNLDQYSFSLTAGQSLDLEATAISAGVTLDNGFTGGAMYNMWEVGSLDVTHTAVSVGYTFDAFAIGVNYGMFDPDGANNDSSGWGIAGSYDLGGGASIHAAYGDSDVDGQTGDFQSWSFGLAMSF